jgi:two-component system cell cycle sensor histidine kinase/response regulator CckA
MVEDDEHARQLAAAVLERAGFQVFQAGDATEAAELWDRHNLTIDILLADIVMPGWSGPEIAQQFLSSRPNLKVIFTSGYDEERVSETTKLVKGARFIRKPYIIKNLVDLVRSRFDEPPSSAAR